MRRGLRLGFRLGRCGCGIVAVALALGLGVAFTLHLEPMTMLTGSMGDAIPPGSLVLTRSVPPSTLRVGDVITFQKPRGEAGLDTHRIVRVDRSDGHTTYRTKGDANPTADPWALEFEGDQVAHRVVTSAPHVGHVLMIGRTRLWAFGVAGAIALLLFSTVVKAIAAGTRQDHAPHEVAHPSAQAQESRQQ
jgi:signal peptidase I